MQKVQELKNNLDYPSEKEPFLSLNNPLNIIKIEHHLNLITDIKKKEISPIEAKVYALETINTRFPDDKWIYIYTDGSLYSHEEQVPLVNFSHSTNMLEKISLVLMENLMQYTHHYKISLPG